MQCDFDALIRNSRRTKLASLALSMLTILAVTFLALMPTPPIWFLLSLGVGFVSASARFWSAHVEERIWRRLRETDFQGK